MPRWRAQLLAALGLLCAPWLLAGVWNVWDRRGRFIDRAIRVLDYVND